MKTKILLLSLVFLFTVKLASAQIYIPQPATTTNTSFQFEFGGETTSEYVVSAYVVWGSGHTIPSTSISSVSMWGVTGSYGAGPSYASGTVTMQSGYTSGGIAVELEVGIYDPSADRIRYETMWTMVLVN